MGEAEGFPAMPVAGGRCRAGDAWRESPPKGKIFSNREAEKASAGREQPCTKGENITMSAEELIHTHDAEHTHGHSHMHDADHVHEHSHTHDAEHTHEHNHTHDADHVHEHSHTHDSSHHHNHSHTHDPKEVRAIVNRLKRSIGHLDKVRRMVEEGEDCADVLIQLSAVKSEINNTGKLILKQHMEHCIVEAVRENDQEAIERMNEAIDRFMK